MRKFTMVKPSLWRSLKFRQLETSEERLLFLYFNFGPHQTIAGCFPLPDEYAASDLCWQLSPYQERKNRFIEAGSIQYDEDAKEMLLVGWFEDNPPKGVKHYQGILNQIDSLQSVRLKHEALEAANAAWDLWKLRQPENSIVGGKKGDVPYDLNYFLRNRRQQYG